jgi:crotonobetainyl-CoA:carnitine CoA-transferase CaiB-like acyl-CoA transferase
VHLHAWAGKRTYAELAKDLTAHDAVFGPVFDASDISKDPHYLARGDLVRVPDAQLGSVLMQGVVPKFPARDHTVTHAGPARGVDNAAVYRELGFSEADLQSTANCAPRASTISSVCPTASRPRCGLAMPKTAAQG